MTAFTLLGQARTLVNKYFKTNIIILFFLMIGVTINMGVDYLVQPTEENLIIQAANDVFGLHPSDFNDPQTLSLFLVSQDVSQLGEKMMQFVQQVQIRNILLALLGISFGLTILGSLMKLGEIAIGLEIGNNKEQKSWKQFFAGWSKILPYWGLSFLELLVTMLGLIFFILPGIYISCRLLLSSYILIAEDISVIDALQKSRKISKGHTRLIFKTAILLGLAQLLGLIAMGIGLIWTYPMTWITRGKLYHILSNKKEIIY